MFEIEIKLSCSEFNPEVIMKSGQVFRMYKEDGVYYAFSGIHEIGFHESTHGWKFYTTSEKDWNMFWIHYFGLSGKDDYESFNTVIRNSDDEFLKAALDFGQGMRILQQDLWETIVSFIISQQNNIPKITKTINKFCVKLGEEKEFMCKGQLKKYHTFPTAVKISDLSLSELLDDSLLGYCAKYILLLAQDVSAGTFSLNSLKGQTNSEKAVNMLQTIYGVGPKVSNCISLYGLHHMDSYPIDVWVNRIIEQDYSNLSLKEYLAYINGNYKGFQGYVQQLQFFYKRNLQNKL